MRLKSTILNWIEKLQVPIDNFSIQYFDLLNYRIRVPWWYIS